MNKITFVLLTIVVTLFTGFLGLIPMLVIGFNRYVLSRNFNRRDGKRYVSSLCLLLGRQEIQKEY